MLSSRQVLRTSRRYVEKGELSGFSNVVHEKTDISRSRMLNSRVMVEMSRNGLNISSNQDPLCFQIVLIIGTLRSIQLGSQA